MSPKSASYAFMPNRIKEVRQAKGLTLEQAAELIGTSPQQINRLERGERRLTTEWLKRISDAWGCRTGDLLPPEPEDGKSSSIFNLAERIVESPARSRRTIPVLGVAVGGEDAFFAMNGNAHEYVEAPSILESVENAYALYMFGSSMEPKYEAGQMLYVHPYKPIRINNYVVVQLTDGRAMVKRLVRRTASKIVLKQFSPEQEFDIPLREVKAVHKIVHADEVD